MKKTLNQNQQVQFHPKRGRTLEAFSPQKIYLIPPLKTHTNIILSMEVSIDGERTRCQFFYNRN